MSEAKYECFSDPSYFDQWCVREIGERRFGYGFHVPTHAEAMGLCALLNGLTAERDALSAQLRAAREQEPVAHIDDLGHIQFTDGGKLKRGDRLYAAPVPPSQEAIDAERYRFLLGRVDGDKAQTLFERELDAAILAAKGGE